LTGKIISRIAPTPSGYLHAGNAYNFILTYLFTRAQNGVLHLRIDDYDEARYRDEYAQNVFDVLEFLGLNYDCGAKNLSEFKSKFSSKFKSAHAVYHATGRLARQYNNSAEAWQAVLRQLKRRAISLADAIKQKQSMCL